MASKGLIKGRYLLGWLPLLEPGNDVYTMCLISKAGNVSVIRYN